MRTLRICLVVSSLLLWAASVACGPGPTPQRDAGTPDTEDAGVADTTTDASEPGDADAGRPDVPPDVPDADRDADATDAEPPGEICDDGVDNDGDSDVDCADESCADFDRCSVNFMASGRAHACGVLASGEVVCWGRNDHGQLGNGETLDGASRPVFVDGIDSALEVAVGLDHSCARLEDGTLRCWGRNHRGQLGDDSFVSSPFPVEVEGVVEARDVAAGGHHACAVLKAAGNLWCWGDNSKSQAGSSEGDRRRTPGPIASFGEEQTDYTSVSSGIEHVCALELVNPDGDPENQLRSARCWGANALGQLGFNRDNTDEFVLAAPVYAGGNTIQNILPGSLAAGQNSTCVIRDGGTVWCWGDGAEGVFGSTDTTPKYQAVEVPGLGDARRLWHELFHVCAERESGRVACWGSNATFAFADDARVYTDPVLLGDLQNPRDLGLGDQFTCWANTDGRGYCRGAGESGQLGRPITDNATATPQLLVPTPAETD